VDNHENELEAAKRTIAELEVRLRNQAQGVEMLKQELQQNYNEMRRYTSESILMFSLGRLANSKFEAKDAIQIFIEGICKLTDWQIGHFYKLKEQSEGKFVLNAQDIWFLSDELKYDMFKVATDARKTIILNCVPLTNINQPNYNWNDSDIIDDEMGSRVKILRHFEFGGICVFPIVIYGKTIGYAEFFSKSKSSDDKNTESMISTALNQLTVLLERKYSETQVEKNYKKLETVHHELLEAQSQLLQQSTLASIGQLSAGVAHELNTPIQYIGDNARFLQHSFKLISECLTKTRDLLPYLKTLNTHNDQRLVELIEKISNIEIDYFNKEISEAIQQTLQGVDHVISIVRSMNVFSHPGNGKKVPTDMNDAVRNMITLSKGEWSHVAKIEQQLDPNLPLVECLPSEVNQVLLNLISNAAHAISKKFNGASESSGVINISTCSSNDYIEISISDNGSGIPSEIESRIFEPFFTTKDVGSGTGQGLTIVHAIIEKNHHGTISFQSKEGLGTTFIVKLPIQVNVP